MRVFVTGGSGRIGAYVLRELLSAGHSASCFSRTPPAVEGVGFLQGDLLDPDSLREAVPGHDAIMHLAASAAPKRATPEQLIHVNVMGTVHVLEAAVQAGVEKVVFASSVSANGFTFARHEMLPRYLPLDEEHPCEPQDAYGLSKVVGELTCKQYSDAYGLQTICLRLGNNWHRDRAGADVVVRSQRGSIRYASVEELWAVYRQRQEDPDSGYPPGRKVFWDGVDARDTAVAFRLALENSEIVHEVFMVLSDETYSTTTTPELITRYFPGVPLKTPLEGYASLVSHEKAARMLGYQPEHRWRESEFGAWREGRDDPV